jgi:hypothetical protein
MIPETDIRHCAQSMIHHGDGAAEKAKQRADYLMEQGVHDDGAVCQRIHAALDEWLLETPTAWNNPSRLAVPIEKMP